MIRQIQRTLVFFVGVFLIAMGIAISVRADLGTAPIASLPTVLSFATPVSVGTYIMSLNLLFVGLQALVLRRKFRLFQLIQIPVAVAFGLLVDTCMQLTSWLDPSSYFEQWCWIIVSVVSLALGVYIEVQPRLTYLPGDGIVFAIYTVLQNIPYGTVKVVVDTIMVGLAVLASWTLLGGLFGVREGTVFSALTVGIIIRVISRIDKRIRKTSAED